MCMYFPDIGTHTCRYNHSGGSIDVHVYFKKYLDIPTTVCVTILLYFAKLSAHTAPVSVPVYAPDSEEVEPQQRALGEAMKRTHVKVMVERM